MVSLKGLAPFDFFFVKLHALSLVLVLVLGVDAREPISPPPQTKAVRARDLGIPFDGTPGKFNAITDVAGVEVGYTTLISGEGKIEVGKGPVRTGVTAIIPRGHDSLNDPVYAGVFSLNGNGEMTGTAWVEESGFLEGPVVITNTHSVGVARDAVDRLARQTRRGRQHRLLVEPASRRGNLGRLAERCERISCETGGCFSCARYRAGGAIEEGSVGGGTGMICYEFKGGNGTASRKIEMKAGKESPARTFTVGVFVQANCGRRPQLMIAGVPVGKEIPGEVYKEEAGSIIIVVATDAPLLPNQLKRLARRASLGLARTGSVSGNGSGDLFIAFSTANPNVANPDKLTHSVETIPNDLLDPIFAGVVQATEEAIVNALVDNHDMTGRDNHHVDALPHERVRELLKKYNRTSP